MYFWLMILLEMLLLEIILTITQGSGKRAQYSRNKDNQNKIGDVNLDLASG